MPAFTGAEASAAACPRHGRCFSPLPPSPKAFPLDGSAVLNDRPVACQIRGPTDPQGDRWHGEAVADEVSPRSGVKPPARPRRSGLFCAPARATFVCGDKSSQKHRLDLRSKRLSFLHFFLRRKKCGRRRPPPRQGETDSPPGQRPPRKRKKRDGLRRLFLYLISCPCGSATPAPAPARISASCSPPPACRSGCPARSTSRTQTWPR